MANLVVLEVKHIAVDEPARVQKVQNAVHDLEADVVASPSHQSLVVCIREKNIEGVV